MLHACAYVYNIGVTLEMFLNTFKAQSDNEFPFLFYFHVFFGSENIMVDGYNTSNVRVLIIVLFSSHGVVECIRLLCVYVDR